MSKIITKTLVCLYGSSNDADVLEGAMNVSKAFGAHLLVAASAEGERNSATIISNKLQSYNSPVERISLPNEHYKSVIKIVDETAANLVVVSHTKNTQSLINGLEVPVLSILDGFAQGLIKNILMPIHDDPGTRQKIPVATEIAKTFGATINILVVAGNNHEEITKLKTYAYQAEKYIVGKGGRCSYTIETGKKVVDETIRVANQTGVDMVIIMNDRGGGWFGKSLSEQITEACKVPVLVVEPKDTTISYAQL